MSSPSCTLCSSPKANLKCDVCGIAICKSCTESIDSHDFSFFKKKPEILKLQNFCVQCFDAKVVPEKARYDELMGKANESIFLTKNYRGWVPVLKRYTKRVEAGPCADRRECILRLAFFSAELGFNAIIESIVESKKIRKGAYQTSSWSGSALPADVDGARLERASLKGF